MNDLIPLHEAILARIAAAARRAHRDPADVTLVAVTKTHGPEVVRDAIDAGMTLFGENKVQEAAWKIPLCPSSAHWHLIGHLQSNKARHAVRLFQAIHSVDSAKQREAAESRHVQRIYEEAGLRKPRGKLRRLTRREAIANGHDCERRDEVVELLELLHVRRRRQPDHGHPEQQHAGNQRPAAAHLVCKLLQQILQKMYTHFL